MKFGSDDEADASQVDDRRGQGRGVSGLGVGAGGLGIVGTLLFLAFRLLGGDAVPDGSARAPGGFTGPASNGPGAPAGASLGGSCQGASASVDQAKFVSCVESNVQAFWRSELRGYSTAKLVLFSAATSSGCGEASAATGPFYCPVDHEVYLDLGFFQLLHTKLGAKGGDFAEAYVVAHEYGHHVQSLLGIERKFRRAVEEHPSQANALSVRLELQADCFAGVWGHAAYEKGKVARAEIADAMDAAASVGDDRIQREVTGRVSPETFTHGSSAERQRWFGVGMTSGDRAQCDTFEGRL